MRRLYPAPRVHRVRHAAATVALLLMPLVPHTARAQGAAPGREPKVALLGTLGLGALMPDESSTDLKTLASAGVLWRPTDVLVVDAQASALGTWTGTYVTGRRRIPPVGPYAVTSVGLEGGTDGTTGAATLRAGVEAAPFAVLRLRAVAGAGWLARPSVPLATAAVTAAVGLRGARLTLGAEGWHFRPHLVTRERRYQDGRLVAERVHRARTTRDAAFARAGLEIPLGAGPR